MNKTSTKEMKLHIDDIDIYLAKTKTKIGIYRIYSDEMWVDFKTIKTFKTHNLQDLYTFINRRAVVLFVVSNQLYLITWNYRVVENVFLIKTLNPPEPKVNALVADRVLIADRLTHWLTFKKYIKLTLL